MLGAYDTLRDTPDPGVLFVVDGDYDVRAGTLAGGHSLVISENADVEGDLASLGLMKEVVYQVLPHRFSDRASVAEDTGTIAAQVVKAIGHVRCYCRLNGPQIGFTRLDYECLFQVFDHSGDECAVIRAVANRCEEVPLAERVEACSCDLSNGLQICNGHDLLKLVAVVLQKKYEVPRRRLGNLDATLRLAMDERSFRRWSVARRLRSWQTRTGRRILSGNISM